MLLFFFYSLEESDMNMSEQMKMLTTDSQYTEIGDADQKQIEKENMMMFLSFWIRGLL